MGVWAFAVDVAFSVNSLPGGVPGFALTRTGRAALLDAASADAVEPPWVDRVEHVDANWSCPHGRGFATPLPKAVLDASGWRGSRGARGRAVCARQRETRARSATRS
jgi:hypothetical protein